MEGEGSHGTLIAHVKDDMVVGLHAVVEPHDLRCQQRQVAHPAHQMPAVRMQLEVMAVETIATGVSKEQRTLIGAFQIREIGGVGVGTGPLERIRRRRNVGRLTRQRTCPEESQQRQQQTEDALRQTEEDAAALAGRARGGNGADGEDLADLPVLLDDTLTVEQSEAVGGLKIILTDGFGIEEMGQLLLGHTLTGVLDGDLHAVVMFRSRDGHAAVATGELTGIVGNRVQHEEGEHLVGFHHCLRRRYRQFHTLHLERCTALGEDVEESLQREALDMQAEVSLTQLNPVSEHIVIGIDLVGEFTHVVEPFLPALTLQTAGLVDDAVDKRCDAVDERDLRPLFQVQPLGVLHAQPLYRQLLTLLFKQVVGEILSGVFAVHVVEQPQREQQQHDGYHHRTHHDIQLYGRLLILTGSRLQLTVLTGGLLKVEIQVTVIVALLLVVDGGKGHAQLLTDRGHQVGGLVDERIGEGLLEVIEGTFVVAYLTETGCERSVGTGYLIDIAVLFEDIQRVLGQPACQHILVHVLGIDEFQGGQVVGQQLSAAGVVHQVFRQGLEGVGRKKRIVGLTGHEEAAHQPVKLLLVDLLLGALGDDAAGTNIIEIV